MSFPYDTAGRLISDTAPTGERRAFLYDGHGQLVGVDLYDPTTGHSRNIRMSYDGLGKLVERGN